MKKVAILTFHRALNYGAKYQAFALLSVINRFNDGYILDYRCKQIENFFYRNIGLKCKGKNIMKWVLFPKYMKDLRNRKKRFQDFDCFYKYSKTFTPQTIQEADDDFDVFIAGSDQIWNPVLTGNDLNFFLPFCKEEKRNTYAASLGKAKLTDFNIDTIDQLLINFRTITVREVSMVNHIKSLAPQVNPLPVCDPVFLLKAKEWEQSLNLVKYRSNEKYIFVYIVAPQTNAVNKAKRIAKQNGWTVKYIDMGRIKQEGIDAVNDAGPIEFLNLMLNAELVITTSFHALALSMIFHKSVQFELSKEKVNANSRLVDLVTRVNMMKYEITDVDDVVYDDYEWDRVDNEIAEMRHEAIDLLKKMIGE